MVEELGNIRYGTAIMFPLQLEILDPGEGVMPSINRASSLNACEHFVKLPVIDPFPEVFEPMAAHCLYRGEVMVTGR